MRFTEQDLAWLAGTGTLAPCLRGRDPAPGPALLHSPGLLRLSAEVDRRPS